MGGRGARTNKTLWERNSILDNFCGTAKLYVNMNHAAGCSACMHHYRRKQKHPLPRTCIVCSIITILAKSLIVVPRAQK